jgi:prolyl-tRNA synthetase
MGALIMSHSDDNGLVLPPKLAPIQVVIVPIYKGEEGLQKITDVVTPIKKKLEAMGVSVKFDNRDTQRPGWKFAEYELKGIPVRVAVGERDLENRTVEIARRDTLLKETVSIEGIEERIVNLLEEWELLKVVDSEKVQDPISPLSHIKVLSHKEKTQWELCSKYNIGKKKG